MLKVYNIITAFNYSQTHCVVAGSMAEAEKIYKDKYNDIEIKKIELHSNYVLVTKNK